MLHVTIDNVPLDNTIRKIRRAGESTVVSVVILLLMTVSCRVLVSNELFVG